MKKFAEIYTAADLFVNPSVEEPMGLTTVKALACGSLAIIIYNATAIPKVIGVSCGIVVEKGDIDKLSMEFKVNRVKQIKTNSCIKIA